MDFEDDVELDFDDEKLEYNEIEQDLGIKIENVVASASLDQTIDLLSIMKVFRNVEYRPKQFPGLVYRLKRPKTATLILAQEKWSAPGQKAKKWLNEPSIK